MASAIDATYLRQAVKNILVGATTLVDNDNEKVFGVAQEYITPIPTNPSWLVASFNGVSVISEPDGFPSETQVWSIPFWLGIGSASQEYTGVQVSKLWEVVPLWVTFMKAHPTAQFSNATTIPDNLDSGIGIIVPDQTFTLQTWDTDANELLYVPVTIDIPFLVDIERIKYQDGNEVIIT